MKNPKVSIIITPYKRPKELRKCLKSIFRSKSQGYEIIVVDNNPANDNFEVVKSFPSIKYIKNMKNVGFAKANNIGMKQAKGEYIFLLNEDTEIITPNWMEELLKVAESSKDIGILTSKIFLNKERIFDAAGSNFDIFGSCTGIGQHKKDQGQYEQIREVFYAFGAVMMIKKEVLSKIGYFDELFFMYGDDADLCWRAWLAGYKTVYVPRVEVIHSRENRYLFQSSNVTKRHYYLKFSRLALVTKNHIRILTMFQGLLGALTLCLAEGLFHLFIYRNVNSLMAILKAISYYFKNLKLIFKKRAEVQTKRVIPESHIFKVMIKYSITLDTIRNILSRRESLSRFG